MVDENIKLIELPEGWVWTTIEKITLPFETIQPNKTLDKKFQYIDIVSIESATQTITNLKNFLGRDAPSRARRVVKKGDILFSTVRAYLKKNETYELQVRDILLNEGQSRELVGRPAIYRGEVPGSCFQNTLG